MDQRLREQFVRICGAGAVLHEPLQLLTYECDGAAASARTRPRWWCSRPPSRRCRRSCALCSREGVPFVARGHGTGLSGGALPVTGGVVIALARLNRILDVDIANRRVTVEPGVTNLDITKAVAAVRLLLRARSVESAGLLDRRQRGRELRRRPLPEVRLHRPSRAGARGGAARRRAGAHRQPDGRYAGARPDRAVRRIGRHARRSSTKIVVRILRRPESVQTLLAAFDSIDAGGRGGVGDHRRGHHPGGGRDDGRARAIGPRKRRCTRIFPTPTRS